MDIKETIRKQAQDEFNQEMIDSGMMPSSDNVLPSKIKPARLSSTAKELELLLFAEPNVREGFSVSEDMVTVPVYLAKVDGNADDLVEVINRYKKVDSVNIDVLTGFHLLKRKVSSNRGLSNDDVFSEGSLNFDVLKNLQPIKILSLEKQQAVLTAIKEIIKIKNKFDILDNVNDFDVVLAAIYENDRLWKMYNHYDYKKTPPKLIVYDHMSSSLNYEAVVRFLLYHLLGFDVLIISNKSYSSIENYFPSSFYDVYRYDEKTKKEVSSKNHYKPGLIFAVFLILAVLVFAVFKFYI